MLSIVYPPDGARDDYCYSVACLLAKWGKWKAEKIDTFIGSLAEKNNDDVRERNRKGTHAHKQLNKSDGRLKGLPALMGILKVSAEAIKDIFSHSHSLMEVTSNHSGSRTSMDSASAARRLSAAVR